MKKPYLTEETIKQAFTFLKSRKDHAHTMKNKEWESEFENSLRVIEELSARKR
ncbi:hypothetical protein [Oceanispirochaeta sp.]|jgi:hypothetical protein|uniref:hypothetical protein n=1 Tax=Oceanispirochaeta sp. TaxID=2035350 RepID=UPI00262D31E8|nr:hypothetical protein [Oceanispirochaeta sp.]MDA3957553.1 hypothetical protein [Oceanispirochaeta sp.]